MKRLLSYLPPLLLLTLAGGLSCRHYHQLRQLDEQLAYSTSTLAAENAQAAGLTYGTLQTMQAAVEKNRNQPADVVRFRRAEALHEQVKELLQSCEALDARVRYEAGATPGDATGLRRPAQRVFAEAGSPTSQQWRALREQVTTCTDSLRRVSPAAARPVRLPAAAPGTSAVQARADLATTAHQLLASEAAVLRQLSKNIGRKLFLVEPIALATADNNVVAPGDTYRAHLLLAGHFPADLRMDMRCNGRPVFVDSLGIGRVRFQAPLRPGPAAWTGTIRINQNGRDTTFVVRVPYRVAAR